jgi:hypothetical protein
VAQSRPCRLEAAPLREVSDWVEQYCGFWEQSFDRLDVYLRELRRGENEDDSNPEPPEQELIITRVFDAAPELVFE